MKAKSWGNVNRKMYGFLSITYCCSAQSKRDFSKSEKTDGQSVFSPMQPFSPESIVETKRLNYGEMSTEKCMALFRRHHHISTAKTKLAVSSIEFPCCLFDEG